MSKKSITKVTCDWCGKDMTDEAGRDGTFIKNLKYTVDSFDGNSSDGYGIGEYDWEDNDLCLNCSSKFMNLAGPKRCRDKKIKNDGGILELPREIIAGKSEGTFYALSGSKIYKYLSIGDYVKLGEEICVISGIDKAGFNGWGSTKRYTIKRSVN